LADFNKPYLERVLKPLSSALGQSKAANLLFESFEKLGLSPFTLDASGYHELVVSLYGRLAEDKLIDNETLKRLSTNWDLDKVPESEVLGPQTDSPERTIALPDDPKSMCQTVLDTVLKGTLAKFQVSDESNEMQRSVSKAMGLVMNSISKLKDPSTGLYSRQATAFLAAQLERYERITAFSRQLNTVDMERLREKIKLLPDVLAVDDVAVLVADESGTFEPFYVSMEEVADDFTMGLLLASLAEEAGKRRGVVSGFEETFADMYHDSIASAGFSPYWLAFPLLIEDKFLGAVIAFGESSDIWTEDETNAIMRVCNHLASALQSCIHYKNVKNLEERLDRELRGVGTVQKRLLPEVLPQIPGCEVWAFYQPSGRASGDYYDVVKTSEGTLSFIVADVSGHGAPAAVVMAMSKTAFRLLLAQGTPIEHMFPKFNDYLCDNLSADMFVTAMGGSIDVAAGLLQYISAGHSPAILLQAKTGECEVLSEHGILLGVLPGQEFPATSVRIAQGDKLIIYTDGITEAKNGANEEFGEKRLIEAIKQASASSAEEMANNIIDAVTKHTNGLAPNDDRTLLIFSF